MGESKKKSADLSVFRGKVILITGGTGSFGKSFARFLLEEARPQKVIIFGRDEFKQFNIQQEFAAYHKHIRYFLGDIRDLSRLQLAFRGVDIVIHAAALKQVPVLEYNPFEAIQTNILGTQNVITASLDQGVKKVLLISTDKAVEPVSLYGATKLCAEKILVDSNVYSAGKTRLSAVRYGNVIGSRGSIVETLLKKPGKNIDITHEGMTRFWITLQSSHELVVFAMQHMVGGEIFVPKIPSMRLVDLFKALAPHRKAKVVGMRPGEKLHEVLLTDEESKRGFDVGKHFVIVPHPEGSLGERVMRAYRGIGKPLPFGFRYSSDSNDQWLNQEDIKRLVGKSV